jgi:hypothetical protein
MFEKEEEYMELIKETLGGQMGSKAKEVNWINTPAPKSIQTGMEEFE